jgi:hypothetical protein
MLLTKTVLQRKVLKMRKLFVFLGLACFMIASCSALNGKPDKPPIEFDPAYLNQQIKLIAIKNLSAFQTKYPVAVLLEYDSTNEIVLSSNYNLRIFIQQDGQWLEVKDQITMRPKDPIVLSPSIPSSYGQSVMFFPSLDDLTKTYHMRVYVFGDMKTQAGTQRVAAFVDFVLTP